MTTKRTMYFLLVLTVLLGACAPASQAPSDEEIRQQIETGVALTVSAGETLTAEAQSLATATASPIPPPSFTPLPTLTPFATLTPFVVVPGGGGGGGGGGSGGSGGVGGIVYSGEPCGDDPKYAGDLIDQTPHDSSPETILKVTDTLDVRWTIKNVGTKTWQPTWAWMFYYETVNSDEPANKLLSMSPTAFTPVAAGPGALPIGDTIETGEFITLGVELTAPAAFEGRKSIDILVVMAIVGDGVKFCQPNILITVIRPGMTP